MKKVTCAIVIIDEEGNILGCHGNGKSIKNGYDFPKGCRDESDNSDFEAALRELREETGYELTEEEKSGIVDAGTLSHNKEKDIHIFIHRVNKFPNLSQLKCTSCFIDKHGNKIPEVDGYRIIKKNERKNYFYHVLQDKFEIIDNLNGEPKFLESPDLDFSTLAKINTIIQEDGFGIPLFGAINDD